MNNSNRFDAFEKLETIEASKLNLQIGHLPANMIPVVKKNQLDNDFIIYLISKVELEYRGDTGIVRLGYPLIKEGVITTHNASLIPRFRGLAEETSNILRII